MYIRVFSLAGRIGWQHLMSKHINAEFLNKEEEAVGTSREQDNHVNVFLLSRVEASVHTKDYLTTLAYTP